MGDDRLLRVARRFADLVVERFAESGLCGHPEAETALVELTGRRASADHRPAAAAAARKRLQLRVHRARPGRGAPDRGAGRGDEQGQNRRTRPHRAGLRRPTG
ncbi:hypothetical protein [Nonomuraea terrae]|uniref:hypothetical protein n=1 Tax=Nonomuraea terrae TaxID=2530383 RepID=UPI003CCC5040